MKKCFFVSFFLPLFLVATSDTKIQATYSSLDPKSVAKNFAFYQLYPDTIEGHLALERAWELLNQDPEDIHDPVILPELDLEPIIALVNRQDIDPIKTLDEKNLTFIENLASHLGNRKLKGFGIWDKEILLELPFEEVDLCRGLFLAETEDIDSEKNRIRHYEACMDLMALQILARLPKDPSPKQKIRYINDFIFHQMRYRFPPHSLWAKDIDVYTFLPSVIDNRRGVCLGVSILYICLAQRLELPLEAVTPPGHIYVRYRDENGEIVNIETTARGINPPSEVYLGIETRKLQLRNYKEVIGLAFINQASVSWRKKEFETAVALYEKALCFLPNDYLLNELLGFNYLFVGRIEEGRKLLESIQGTIPDFAVSKDTISQDYLAGRCDPEAIKAIFLGVDETRLSILMKRNSLETVTDRYPRFRAGLLQLAGSWLQLGREKEAYQILKRYQELDANEPVVNYYLAVIAYQRYDFNESWKYLLQAEKLVLERDHNPRALKDFRKALKRACPQPKRTSTS